jgi:FdhE protein
LLHACERVWRDERRAGWDRGECPVCAAWPTLAEARGLERERRLRCGRCGSDWWIEWLRCPYCGARDHTALGALAPEATRETRKLETCARCHAYVKTLTTLVPIPPADLMLEDLATVDLDIVALCHGYRRPEPPMLDLHLVPRATRLRGWPRLFGSAPGSRS